MRPRAVTTFQFTPDQIGSFDIQHTKHGFSGTLIVEEAKLAEIDPPKISQSYKESLNP